MLSSLALSLALLATSTLSGAVTLQTLISLQKLQRPFACEWAAGLQGHLSHLSHPIPVFPEIHVMPWMGSQYLLSWLQHPLQVTWHQYIPSSLVPHLQAPIAQLCPESPDKLGLILAIAIAGLSVNLSTWFITLVLAKSIFQRINNRQSPARSATVEQKL